MDHVAKLRAKPCKRGHSRRDAYCYIDKRTLTPFLICRKCCVERYEARKRVEKIN